jgi:peptidoglycan L-alanyl-D-glutamate endopeptidase CwlK
MDQDSIDKLNLLHPKLRDLAISCYNQAVAATPVGVHPYVVATYRTFEESAALYAQGRTTPGQIVTNAQPGQSYHNYGLAVDFGLIINGQVSYDVDANWMTVVNIFDANGFNWGGNFPDGFHDNPHLENKMGTDWEALLVLHNEGKFIDGTTYVDF